MAQQSNSETVSALRSFLPEERLIRAGDFDALDLKYEAQTADSRSNRMTTLKGLDYDDDESGRESTLRV